MSTPLPSLPPLLPGRLPPHLRRFPTPRRAVRFATRWARGTTSVALRYPLELVPSTRRDAAGPSTSPDDVPDLAAPLPGDPGTVQRAADGVGPLFHRRYWVDVEGAARTPDQLMALLHADVNLGAPPSIGRFEDADGRGAGALHVGDEYLVRLPGPWHAPVRVVDLGPTSFRLATLSGHIEAGEIEFRTLATGEQALRFEIESWARSSAALLHLLYDVLPIAREVQLVMWSRMCRNTAGLAGGRTTAGVRVSTQRLSWPLPGGGA